MSSRRASAFSLLGVVSLVLPAYPQSVISTHSGLVHFFEGSVYLDGRPLEPHLGKFPTVPQGGELRTAEGRAEVLLSPGVFLRMGEQSAIRMVANDLADTQVELQTGSAVVDSGEPNRDTSLTLTLRDWRIHFLKKGVYRIDSNPPRLCVRQGEAEVSAGDGEEPVSVENGMSLPFAGVLVPEPWNQESGDALNAWENGRSESIVADNAITAQIGEDPASRADGSDAFTYFPFLDVPTLGLGWAGAYSSAYAPYQPGFSSIYLPGYNYRPIMLGPVGRGLRIYAPSYPIRIGVSPGGIGVTTFPRAPGPRVPGPLGPTHTTAPHPGVGVHVGGHR